MDFPTLLDVSLVFQSFPNEFLHPSVHEMPDEVSKRTYSIFVAFWAVGAARRNIATKFLSVMEK